jgi:3-oxoacyl-[acyl-carrier protein] reductase
VNNQSMDLSGKIALVTGGSRGIRRAIAIALADTGAHVAVNYKENKTAAEEVVTAITKSGRRAIAIGADVSIPQDVESMVATIAKELGEIGILVNNAGVARARKIEDIDLALFDEAINVNLRSAFLVTSAVLPAMRRGKRGRLIFISSTAANVGGIVGPHYAASKAGMIGLMHSYASNLVKEGITANVVSPALDMVRSDLRVTPDRIPVGRFGRPEEVADVAVMLARNGYNRAIDQYQRRPLSDFLIDGVCSLDRSVPQVR